MMSRLKDYDFYRNIPKDLTESSTRGSMLSVGASIFMFVLIVAVLWALITKQTITNVVIDPNIDSLLRINFNITTRDELSKNGMISHLFDTHHTQ